VIRAIYILVEGGVCIYSRAYDTALADPLLMSSFISAVSEFSREAMGDDLRGIESGGRFVFVADHDQISTIVIADDPDEIDASVIDYISMNFVSKYSTELQGDTGNPKVFSDFDAVLERTIPPELLKDTRVDPKDPLDGLSLMEIPPDLKSAAMLLIREQTITARNAARELRINENAAIQRLDAIVALGKAGRREGRGGTIYFV
jgi:hypothetical protein